MNASEKTQKVIYYHERTKHLPGRYARSAGFMDWANEPFPFRAFEGAPLIRLPLKEKDPETGHDDMYRRIGVSSKPMTINNIGKCLELSLALSAWKSFGNNRWSLRINPSSGNLHPTEAYLILPPLPESESKGTISHYNPLYHALEIRASFNKHLWEQLSGSEEGKDFFIALTSIYWREAWKYGERAFRYCNLDMGHALAAISFSASLLGWRVSAVTSLSADDMDKLIGFQKTDWQAFEREYTDILLYIHKGDKEKKPLQISRNCIDSFNRLAFIGKPNRLSKGHENWQIIDKVSLMTEATGNVPSYCVYSEKPFISQDKEKKEAAGIIRQRRSAQSYDGKTFIDKEVFLALLDKTIPRHRCAPFDAGAGEVNVHLFIFVHLVKGLEQGIYFLNRKGEDPGFMKTICRPDFFWERDHAIPENFPLFLLKKGDYRSETAMLSCQQGIAGDGVFSLGMLGRFRGTVEKDPSNYRRLFHECGMIGQVLYLEAEFAGLRGTGIGCFYDDAVHDLLGIKDNTFQSLYHFTVGKPLEDKRLSTLPPYHHLVKSNKILT